MRNATVRMVDIAEKAGVSRSTVSLVLNQREVPGVRIPEHTRKRILAMAEDMGYRPNQLARSVVTGQNPVFGFIIPSPNIREVGARLLDGALAEAETRHHTVQVIRLTGETDREAIERCVELRPVGVISVFVREASLEYLHQEMARFNIPVAILDSSFPQERGLRIYSDDVTGGTRAVEHLIELGHRRIAYIGGDPGSGASALREQGYCNAMKATDLPIPEGYLQHTDWRPESIALVIRELFGGTEAPTAVFCVDDRTAMVVCRTLRKMGLRVPDDVSVVGFADLEVAMFSDPPLTTVAQPFHTIGRTAVTRLLAATEGTGQALYLDQPYEESLPTRLIIRESTAPVRDSIPPAMGT